VVIPQQVKKSQNHCTLVRSFVQGLLLGHPNGASYPMAWNEESIRKFNPSQNVYLKQLKAELLANMAD
jgi:hypothetical protein